MKSGRRHFLQLGTLLATAGMPLLYACSRDSANGACVDPALLTRGEEQMRATLSYVTVGAADDQTCALCQFFSADSTGQCGHCELLAGPVARAGTCTSWAARS